MFDSDQSEEPGSNIEIPRRREPKVEGRRYDDPVAIICASFAKASSTFRPVFADVKR